MKFDLMSDLHVDLSPGAILDYKSIATSPIAVVAGDISNSPIKTIRELERIAEAYDQVLFVDGNHESYDNKSSMKGRPDYMPPKVYSTLRSAFEGHSKVVYLDQGRNAHIIGDTAFIGANSWYDFNWGSNDPDHCKSAWYQHMNDSYWANIDAEWVENECIRQSSNIAATVAAMNQNAAVKRIVLVTHTIPTEKGIWINPSNYLWNLLNGCYYNSVAQKAHFGKVVAHCFGHTHRRQMFREHAIDFFCNPRGYQGEPSFESWDPMVVDLDYSQSAFGAYDG
jgi:predicted phosphodiesterase